MTERVLKLPLTQPGDIYSLPKQDPSMPSHQLAQRFCSTQNVPFTRADMFGGRHTYELQMFLRQSHGDGKRILQEDGSHCGHCCQKQQCPVQSCYGVAVRRDAWDSANVSKLIWSARHSATSLVIVITMIAIKLCCLVVPLLTILELCGHVYLHVCNYQMIRIVGFVQLLVSVIIIYKNYVMYSKCVNKCATQC